MSSQSPLKVNLSDIEPDEPSGSARQRILDRAAEYGLGVSSTKRSPQRNRAVGGAPNSYHLASPNRTAYDLTGSSEAKAKFTKDVSKDSGAAELFYDPVGGFKKGKSIGAIGGHKDHVHVAFDEPDNDLRVSLDDIEPDGQPNQAAALVNELQGNNPVLPSVPVPQRGISPAKPAMQGKAVGSPQLSTAVGAVSIPDRAVRQVPPVPPQTRRTATQPKPYTPSSAELQLQRYFEEYKAAGNLPEANKYAHELKTKYGWSMGSVRGDDPNGGLYGTEWTYIKPPGSQGIENLPSQGTEAFTNSRIASGEAQQRRARIAAQDKRSTGRKVVEALALTNPVTLPLSGQTGRDVAEGAAMGFTGWAGDRVAALGRTIDDVDSFAINAAKAMSTARDEPLPNIAPRQPRIGESIQQSGEKASIAAQEYAADFGQSEASKFGNTIGALAPDLAISSLTGAPSATFGVSSALGARGQGKSLPESILIGITNVGGMKGANALAAEAEQLVATAAGKYLVRSGAQGAQMVGTNAALYGEVPDTPEKATRDILFALGFGLFPVGHPKRAIAERAARRVAESPETHPAVSGEILRVIASENSRPPRTAEQVRAGEGGLTPKQAIINETRNNQAQATEVLPSDAVQGVERTIDNPNAETAPIETESAVAPENKATNPEWLNSEIDRLAAEADRLGASDWIENLAAQGLTTKEIATQLGVDSDLVRGVKAKRNIPSIDEPADFQAWKESRNQPEVESPIPPQSRPTLNRVFEGGSPLPLKGEGVLPANDATKAYRNTLQPQIDDMIASGEVRAREGKMRGGKEGETHWSKGDESLGFKSGYVIEAPAENLHQRQGGIPINELTAVWESRDGKWTDILPEIKAKRDGADGAPIVAKIDEIAPDVTVSESMPQQNVTESKPVKIAMEEKIASGEEITHHSQVQSRSDDGKFVQQEPRPPVTSELPIDNGASPVNLRTVDTIGDAIPKETGRNSGMGGEAKPAFEGEAARSSTATTRERSLPKTLESHDLSKGDNLIYDVVGNEESVKVAKENLASKGVDGAAEMVRASSDMSAETTATGLAAIAEYQKKAGEVTDKAEKASLFEKANALASDLAEKLTRAGQSIQAVKVIAKFSPERALITAQKLAEKANKKVTALRAEHITESATKIQAVEARVKELESIVADFEAKAKKKVESQRAKVIKQLDEAEAEARARLANLNIQPREVRTTPTQQGSISFGKNTVKKAWELTREEFFGRPRLYTATKQQLNDPVIRKVYAATEKASKEPFINGLQIRRGENQFVVYDGDKVVATYSLGDNLSVDKAYRGKGIASELIYEYKTLRDPLPRASSRSKSAQKIYEQTHRRIVSQAIRNGENVPAEVLKDYPDLAAKQKQQVRTSPTERGSLSFGGGERAVPQVISDLASIMAAKAAKSDVSLADIRKELSTEFGDVYDANYRSIERAANRILTEVNKQPQTGKRQPTPRQELKKSVSELDKWDYKIGQEAKGNPDDMVSVGAKLLADNMQTGKSRYAFEKEMKAKFGDEYNAKNKDSIYKQAYSKVLEAKKSHKDLGDVYRAMREGAVTDEQIGTVRKRLDEARKAHREANLELSRHFDALGGGRRLRLISDWRKAGMLSSIRTHARNFISNTTYQVFDEASRVPAVVADFVASKATGQRSITGFSPSASLDSVITAFTKGGKEAMQIMREGVTAEEAAKLQVSQQSNSGIKIIDTATNAVFRAMAASDRIFYNGSLTRNLIDRAKVQALNEVREGKIKHRDVEARKNELVKTPPDQLLADAKHDALVATFNNNNKISDSIRKVRGSLSPTANFAIDLVMPFDRTPTNVMARVLEASPLGFAKVAKIAAKSIMNKAMSVEEQRQFSQTFGRATTGTSLMTLGWVLGAKGLMSAYYDEDEDPKTRKENRKLKEQGKSPMALKVGNQWVSIGDTNIGNMLAIGATLQKEMSEGKTTGAKVAGIPKTAFQVLSEQPLIGSTKDVFKAGSDIEGRGANYAGRLASSFVPGSGMVRDVATATDSKARKTFGFKGQAIGGIPFVRQYGIPKVTEGLPEDVGVQHRRTWAVDPFRLSTDKKR